MVKGCVAGGRSDDSKSDGTSLSETSGLWRRNFPMPDTNHHSGSMPSVFSPLAKALLDGFSEGVVVFDAEGRVLYANQQARNTLSDEDLVEGAQDLLPRLASIGGRLRPLRIGSLEVGEAMFIPGTEGATTLAEREREDDDVRLGGDHGLLGGRQGGVAHRAGLVVGEVGDLLLEGEGVPAQPEHTLSIRVYDREGNSRVEKILLH